MAKRTVKKETPGAPSRRTTPAARREVEKGKVVRVWSEASITVAVTGEPPQFVKFTHGFERMCPANQEAVKRTEAAIYKICEEIVEKRARKLARLVRRLNV